MVRSDATAHNIYCAKLHGLDGGRGSDAGEI